MKASHIRLEWRAKVKDGIIEQEIDDELVLYDPSTDQVHHLNTTAAAIYDLCDSKTSLAEIIATMKQSLSSVKDFDIEDETVRFLSCLVEKGVLE